MSTVFLALTAALLSGGDNVSVFVGEPGAAGDVHVIPRKGPGAGSAPAGLQGITLLAIDFAGRTEFEEFRPDRPRLLEEVEDAGRLHLPNGAGSLYRFSRPGAGGSITYGFMHVDASGTPSTIGETPGSGPAQDLDPFVPRVAVAADGLGVLAATTLVAGGDLLLLDLATGTATNRTLGHAPQDFHGAGLALNDLLGLGVSSAGILRFDPASSTDAGWVPFAGAAPTWFARELVLSTSGTFAATIAGAGPTAADVYVLEPTGAAERVSGTPGPIPGAGFLPEFPDGPYLAVSDDGSACAWITDDGFSDELFLVQRDAAGLWPSEHHVTQDSLFHPFLDEIGEFIFTPFGALVFAAGDREHPLLGGVTLMDYYRTEVKPGGSLDVFNLSQSYGQISPPFLSYSAMEPERTALTPTLDNVLVHTVGNAGNRILSVAITGHSGTPASLVLDQVEELESIDLSGSDYLLTVERGTSQSPVEVHAFSYDLVTPTIVVPLDEDEPVISQTDSAGSNGLVTKPDGGHLWRIQAATGVATLFSSKELEYGPTLWNAPTGELIFSVEWSDRTFIVRWNTGGGYKRIGNYDSAFVLPGS